jgi:4-hydroxybenzoate polyprenyltransferase
VYDFATDSRNPRKIVNGLQGGVLHLEYHSLIRNSAYISTIFIFGVSLLTREPFNIISIICLIFFGWQYSAPPLRLKEVPVIDSLSNGLIVYLAWFSGFSFSGLGLRHAPSKGLTLSLCTSGIHALGAVMDADVDIAAGQRTIATALGQRSTVAFGAIC